MLILCFIFSLFPFITLSYDFAYIFDVSSTDSFVSERKLNITVLSTGGSKLFIRGYGFSTLSTLSNRVIIDNAIECEIITYYTTPNQIQCIVPPYRKIGVYLDLKVLVDGMIEAESSDKFTIIYESKILLFVY